MVYDQSQGIYGYLNLPAKLGSGCSWSPVQYLVDSSAKCSKILTPQKCSKNSLVSTSQPSSKFSLNLSFCFLKNFQLDYQMYLMPLPKGMDVGNIPKVLKIPKETEKI